jgi:prophage regulatory protein
MKAVATAELRILRIKEVQDRVGYGRSTIYDLINPQSPRFNPHFPAPIKLGIASVGWIESEVTEWIRSRIIVRARGAERGAQH